MLSRSLARFRRTTLRCLAAAGVMAASQLSACVSSGGYFSGEQYQYTGGPGASPGGNFNPVSGTAAGGNGGH